MFLNKNSTNPTFFVCFLIESNDIYNVDNENRQKPTATTTRTEAAAAAATAFKP